MKAPLPGKVETILKGSLDLIPSPSTSMKIQIMGGKVCLKHKGKTLLGVVNKLFVFPPIISIFTEGDMIESRLPYKIFSTLIRQFDPISSIFGSRIDNSTQRRKG